jgi:tRNA-specific 2-thiouridylase
MSGGVDSSVAAGLLVEAGHEVVGATLKLWGGASDSGCCSVADVDDARRVAQCLGVEHHVFNYAEEFTRRVVAPYVEGHAAGRTPNPCIDCNRQIKFALLVERARRLGFDAVSTGHHASVRERAGRYFLVRGADPRKDQSYVLGYLTEAQLSRLVLPIGTMTKDEVRAHGERLGLRTWNKPDSQDVCFIEAARGREAFLRDHLTATPASVVDRATGEVIGAVDVAQAVTVGQRRGIAPGRDGERRYVARVDLAARRVEVDRLAAVMVSRGGLDAAALSFAREALVDGSPVLAQWSAHGAVVPATLRGAGRWWLETAVPVRPVAAGQSVVFYAPDEPAVVMGAALVTEAT